MCKGGVASTCRVPAVHQHCDDLAYYREGPQAGLRLGLAEGGRGPGVPFTHLTTIAEQGFQDPCLHPNLQMVRSLTQTGCSLAPPPDTSR